MQQYLRSELIDLADRPDNSVIFARARQRVRQTGEGLTAEQIVDLRNADHVERETS